MCNHNIMVFIAADMSSIEFMLKNSLIKFKEVEENHNRLSKFYK